MASRTRHPTRTARLSFALAGALALLLAAGGCSGTPSLGQNHPDAGPGTESNGTLWMTAGGPFRTAAAENQGNPAGWPVLDATNATMNEMDQIAQIQQAMFDEGPGSGEAHGHYTNMMNADYTRLGVGLLEVDSWLYLTNDFSN